MASPRQTRGRPGGRLAALGAALAQACETSGVTLVRDAIPYGAKFTLAQGLATGVVSIYDSGKVVPNPAAEKHFADVVGVLAARAEAAPRKGGASAHDEVPYPYVGSDESGKGDYFGPLVVAAVLLRDEREAKLLQTLGVRDSKLLVGTQRPRDLARAIREVCGPDRFAEVAIEPARYNERVAELAAEGKNTSPLLAWAHVAAWAPILDKHRAAAAVVDKFGNERHVAAQAKTRGLLPLEIRQETRGERYTAVAAASILARDLCLAWFERAEAEARERLPRGAFDPGIIDAARRLHARGGAALLGRYAKLHFRTTAKVMAGGSRLRDEA